MSEPAGYEVQSIDLGKHALQEKIHPQAQALGRPPFIANMSEPLEVEAMHLAHLAATNQTLPAQVEHSLGRPPFIANMTRTKAAAMHLAHLAATNQTLPAQVEHSLGRPPFIMNMTHTKAAAMDLAATKQIERTNFAGNYTQIPNANCVSSRHTHNMHHGYVLDLESCGAKCDEHPRCTGFLHDKHAEPHQASCFLQTMDHLDMYARQHNSM